jgi:multicomponent Na+:H+ antiporter subunit F
VSALGPASPALQPILLALVLAIGLALIRLARGPSVADRVVALDLISLLTVGLIAAHAVARREPVLLDVALVIALVTFLATVSFARYIERRVGGRW